MFISETSKYALRAVVCIAISDQQKPIRAKELSLEINIPQHYLSKVLRKLVEAKVLKASKGHNGGFVLARSEKQIKLIQVIEAIEEKIPERQCLFGWRRCDDKEPCVLHNRWRDVNNTFQNWLRSTSLEDVRSDAVGNKWLVGWKKKRLTRRASPKKSLPTRK